MCHFPGDALMWQAEPMYRSVERRALCLCTRDIGLTWVFSMMTDCAHVSVHLTLVSAILGMLSKIPTLFIEEQPSVLVPTI